MTAPRSAFGWLIHLLTRYLTWCIMVGMLLGVAVGYLVHEDQLTGVMSNAYWIKSFGTLSAIFLNLIKMLVAPLVLGTIISGLAHMNDSAAVGRIGFRAILWFIVASLISISLGLVMVNFFQPGVGVDLTAPVKAVGEVKKLDLFEFIEHIFPKNLFTALSENNVLQILVFSLFAGIGLTAIGEKGRPLVRAAEALAELCYRSPVMSCGSRRSRCSAR
jgi:Na+/H+-dicarboxylate symporter